jgi:hypothetical protein
LLKALLIRQYGDAAGLGLRGLQLPRRPSAQLKRSCRSSSRVNQNSEAFRANREQMLALIGDSRARAEVRDFSNSNDRFRARG